MNDYWNDPPEEPEVPECCDLEMRYDEKRGCLWCINCGAHIDMPEDIEPVDEPEPPTFKEIQDWKTRNRTSL